MIVLQESCVEEVALVRKLVDEACASAAILLLQGGCLLQSPKGATVERSWGFRGLPALLQGVLVSGW